VKEGEEYAILIRYCWRGKITYGEYGLSRARYPQGHHSALQMAHQSGLDGAEIFQQADGAGPKAAGFFLLAQVWTLCWTGPRTRAFPPMHRRIETVQDFLHSSSAISESATGRQWPGKSSTNRRTSDQANNLPKITLPISGTA